MPGLRLEPWLIQGNHIIPSTNGHPTNGGIFQVFYMTLDPRLTFRASYGSHGADFLSTAGFGIYHQAPDTQALSAVFGNPNLGLERAIHVNAGVAFKITGTLSLEVVGFYKWLDGLISRSDLPTPPLTQALTQDGVGRVYGGQVLLRQELAKGFFGWLTYSLIRSERKDHPDVDWRLFDFDQNSRSGAAREPSPIRGGLGGRPSFPRDLRHALHAGHRFFLRRRGG